MNKPQDDPQTSQSNDASHRATAWRRYASRKTDIYRKYVAWDFTAWFGAYDSINGRPVRAGFQAFFGFGSIIAITLGYPMVSILLLIAGAILLWDGVGFVKLDAERENQDLQDRFGITQELEWERACREAKREGRPLPPKPKLPEERRNLGANETIPFADTYDGVRDKLSDHSTIDEEDR